MSQFSDFYDSVRLLLGDDEPAFYRYSDDQLDRALRSVFLFGRGPAGYLLSGDDRNIATAIEPDIPTGDPFAQITYEAGLLLIGGDDGAYSYRTRALSSSSSGDRKKDLLVELRVKIYEIVAGNQQFASVQSFVTWLNSYSRLQEAALSVLDPIANGDVPFPGASFSL